MMMRPSREERRALERENAKQPPVLTERPSSEWAHRWPFGSKPPVRVWRSRYYLVQMHEEESGTRLSINRTTFDVATGRWDENISWDELQLVKRECGFADRWAVEIFPPDSEIVNAANMRHLWLLPEAPSFGWKRGT
jgi:hypothetical protein